MNTIETEINVQDTTTSSNESEKMTMFADEAPAVTVGDMVMSLQSLGSKDQSLQDFFSRPLKVYYGTSNVWSSIPINVIQLYFANPAVVRKIANYKYMRFTMNVRYSESYNPYIYGRRYVVTTPLSSNKIIEFPGYLTLPHVAVNPTKANTYEMKVPFMRVAGTYYNTKDLIAGVGFENAITLWQSIQYASADGGAVEGSYSVHAWLTDVELVVPVASGALQSGKAKEYKGMVSAPATAVANASRELSKIPFLKGLMTPIEMAANVTADIASKFGFSKPTQIEAPEPYFWNPDFNMIASSTLDPAQRLTLDNKQGVVVGSEMFDGEKEDNMAFSTIMKRDGLITDRIWTTAFAADTVIFRIPVTPFCAYFATPTRAILAPVGEIASMFRYWRGDLTYTISVIASKFHKGRLRFFWSPVELTVPFTEPISNLVESYVMDITTQSEVKLTVKYCSSYPVEDCVMSQQGTVQANSVNPGYLYCTVHQELSAPNVAADAYVYVSMHSNNMEFAEPTASYMMQFSNASATATKRLPSATTELTGYGGFGQESFPPPVAFESGALTEYVEKAEEYTFNASSSFPNVTKLHIGEAILSYRTLLKAYQLHEWGNFPTSTALTNYWSYLSFSPLPFLAGCTTGQTKTILCNRTYLNHYMESFRYMRGSIRYKIVLSNTSDFIDVKVIRVRGPGVFRYGDWWPEDVQPNALDWRREVQGVAIDRMNRSIQFEIPFTTQKNFYRTMLASVGGGPDQYQDQVLVFVLVRPGETISFRSYVAIGEDFNGVNYNGLQSVFLGDPFIIP